MTWTLFKHGIVCHLFLSLAALADPCGMVPPVRLTSGAPELTRIGDQLTYVFHYKGIEDIVLRPAFKGSVTQFGMLIPFPVPPSLRKVSDDIFTHIQKAIDPPVIVIDMLPKAEAAAAKVADMTLRFEGVKVLKEEAVGMYQIAVLEAKNPKALEYWMTEHGYIYPTGMDKPCMDYIKDGWCFVAVKANIGSKAAVEPKPGMREADPKLPDDAAFEGAVQAMGFRFRIDKPVVPMRLSAFNEGQLFNRVYFLSDRPVRIEQLPEEFVKRRVAGEQLLKNLTEPLPIKLMGATLEQAKQWGMFDRQEYSRDPAPHNGHALDVFAADLLAADKDIESHPFEEREKELLKIGERLGLRGQEVDDRVGEVIAAERKKAAAEVLSTLKNLTLTIIEGDFPRDVIAEKNLTFEAYAGALPEPSQKR
ncbi:MAG: DUF2330 domain-containing protein [Planctomycetota bacterium]|nr:DUF2330 domain-containing protein [Planctomycetota bacterium]MDA1143255.1 DUF2330 domain-containing protein [Planctomycetota bacterium]